MVYYVWMGSAREVFKPSVKTLFKRGVPTEAPALFEDLLEKDPLFVKIDEDEAASILKAYKEAKDAKAYEMVRRKTVKGLEGRYKASIQAHYKDRGRMPKKGPVKKLPARTPAPTPTSAGAMLDAMREPEKKKVPKAKKPKGDTKKPKGGD